MNNKETINEILHFWFEEVTDKQKYTKDEEFDSLIRDKYLDIYNSVVERETKDWEETPEGVLAEIVVLDQFSRNMFRDDKKSFEADDLALKLAQMMVENGSDKEIDLDRRGAIYMPYMHSESKEVHEKALKIFEDYAQESGNKNGLEYEIKHKAIIDEFGRYPHRNEVLGRESTPEEIEFNKEHGGF